MIGWDGYFGNRLSLPEFLHSKKRDPLPDTISLEWTHSSQRLGIIGGPVRFSLTSWALRHREPGRLDSRGPLVTCDLQFARQIHQRALACRPSKGEKDWPAREGDLRSVIVVLKLVLSIAPESFPQARIP